MQVFLDREKYLIGVNRFNEIVGYFVANSLVHNIFFLTLGNHYHRYFGVSFFDAAQCLQTAQSGHILVQNYQVEFLFFAHLKGIDTIRYGCEIVSLLCEKKYMGP